MTDGLWADAEAELPRAKPLFAEPWQGRLVALAVETVRTEGMTWDDFRRRLVGAIADAPDRPYYESFLVALEQLAVGEGLATGDELQAQLLAAASYRTTETTDGDLEVFPIEVGEDRLHELLTTLFRDWWPHIRFGPLIEGAVYELQATAPPRLSMLDGYLTVDLGATGHLHLCIGEHRGPPDRPVPASLAARRRCAHAELQRLWVDGAPRSWMFRMFNGDGHQQLTVLLPNPFLTDEMQVLDAPDWDRLELWDLLRERYLHLPPDPIDRSATRFVHG